MAESRVDGIALGAIGVGAFLAYAGFKGKSVPSLIQAVVTGKSPATATKANPIVGTAGSSGPGTKQQQAAAGANVPAADLTGTLAANKALGAILATAYGWGPGTQQWTDLNQVVMDESGWNNQIYNGGTVGGPYQPNKAYGIAQALGHGTDGAPYPASLNAANPPGAGGSSSARAQIEWMLQYIKNEYGNPAGALNSEQTRGYY